MHFGPAPRGFTECRGVVLRNNEDSLVRSREKLEQRAEGKGSKKSHADVEVGRQVVDAARFGAFSTRCCLPVRSVVVLPSRYRFCGRSEPGRAPMRNLCFSPRPAPSLTDPSH